MAEVNLSIITDKDFKPTLYDVHTVLDEEVVGEHQSRMSVFTNWALANKNVLMSGPRSSGKTFITDHVIPFLGDGVYTIYSGSDKSHWYQIENLKKATHIVILELNKVPKEVLECLKDWGEGKPSIYKTVVFEGGIRKVKSFKIPPKPFIFCLADEEEFNLGEQLSSRLTLVRTDNSMTQNKKVLDQQAKLAIEKTNIKRVDSVMKGKLMQHVLTLPPLSDYEFKHPAADIFVSAIPQLFTDCRRDFPKYLGNTYGIARFNWKERIVIPRKEEGEKDWIIVTPADMWLNQVIYGNNLVESSLKCSAMEREILAVVRKYDAAVDRNYVSKQIRKKGINISTHMVSRLLKKLSDVGYLDSQKVGTTYQYTISEFGDFNFAIDWKEVIEATKKAVAEHYPEIAEKYIKDYCTNPKVMHPFTGEMIDIEKERSTKEETDFGTLTAFTKKTSVSKDVVEEKIEEG